MLKVNFILLKKIKIVRKNENQLSESEHTTAIRSLQGGTPIREARAVLTDELSVDL